MTTRKVTPEELGLERSRALRLLALTVAHLRGTNEALVFLHREGREVFSAEELEEIGHAINATALLVNWEGRERRRAAALDAAVRLQKAEQEAREAEECYRVSRKAVDDATP